MKRNLIVFCALCAAVLISITCAGYMISGREMSGAVVHLSGGEDADFVGNYSELKEQMRELVHTRAESGTVKIKDYKSDMDEDLERVCREIEDESRDGGYEADMVSANRTRVLNYWLVKVSITYKRTHGQMFSATEDVQIAPAEIIGA